MKNSTTEPIEFTDAERRQRARRFVETTNAVNRDSVRRALSEDALNAVAAAQTLEKLFAAARRAGSATGRPTGRNGGRPRAKKVSKATLYQRERRARLATKGDENNGNHESE